MFKKANRLSRVEFSDFYKKGKKYNFSHLTVIIAPFSKNKVSVVVGKKVSNSAVRRNVLKRRVYGQLRKFLLENKKESNIIIIILKPSYNNIPRKTANEMIFTSLNEINKKPHV